MSNIQVHAGSGGSDDDVEFSAGHIQAQTHSLDELLDEIDSVLETNAEAFVQGFVQKGGQ
ncbi:MAG: ubiquitin-like protein Pup [Actinobacteria bacterium]|nr:MAG: ubiquitin-like protein Pup [Actinomycetota bacterium]